MTDRQSRREFMGVTAAGVAGGLSIRRDSRAMVGAVAAIALLSVPALAQSREEFGGVGLLAAHFGAAMGPSASLSTVVGRVEKPNGDFGRAALGMMADGEIGAHGYKFGVGPAFVAGNPLFGPAMLGLGLRYSELRPLGDRGAVDAGHVGRGVEFEFAAFLSIRLGSYIVVRQGPNKRVSTFSIGFGF